MTGMSLDLLMAHPSAHAPANTSVRPLASVAVGVVCADLTALADLARLVPAQAKA
jgi:hypothetical protein